MKKIVLIIVLSVIVIFTILEISKVINLYQIDVLKYELSRYDGGLPFVDVVNEEDLTEYLNMSEKEELQYEIQKLILHLNGDAKYEYSSIDEAYLGEIEKYEETQSTDSLRNICYILKIRREQDYEGIIKYYKLLFEEVKINKTLEDEIGYSIVNYSQEYLNLLYSHGNIDEYKLFFENGDEYTNDPSTWPVVTSEYTGYLDEDDVEIINFHIEVLKKYEEKYIGLIDNRNILKYQTEIWVLAKKINDKELEEEYFEKKNATYEIVMSEINN